MVKKTRVILVNNTLTALFMKAKLAEMDDIKNNIETVVLYESQFFDSGAHKDIKEKEKEKKMLALEAFKDSYKIVSLPMFKHVRIKKSDLILNFLFVRRSQQYNFNNIVNFLSENSYFNKDISEIWYGNNKWSLYFGALFCNACTVKFDHGLTETLVYTKKSKKSLLGKLYVLIKGRDIFSYISRKLLVVPIIQNKVNFHYTLNYKEINNLVGKDIASPLNPNIINECALRVIGKVKNSIKDDARVAVILLEDIIPFTKNKYDYQEYFDKFEKMILVNYADIFKNNRIDTILIKSKQFQEDYAEKAVKEFKKLRAKLNVIYFKDLYGNFPLEYYMLTIKPVVIIGNLSSGLYFCKHLMPSVKTYSFDKWFSNYTINKFGDTHPDLRIIREELFEVNCVHFNKLNPER